jgi:parallel beta-helix repeat protein
MVTMSGRKEVITIGLVILLICSMFVTGTQAIVSKSSLAPTPASLDDAIPVTDSSPVISEPQDTEIATQEPVPVQTSTPESTIIPEESTSASAPIVEVVKTTDQISRVNLDPSGNNQESNSLPESTGNIPISIISTPVPFFLWKLRISSPTSVDERSSFQIYVYSNNLVPKKALGDIILPNSSTPIPNATVTVGWNKRLYQTDENGCVCLDAPTVDQDTSFSISARKVGYQSATTSITILNKPTGSYFISSDPSNASIYIDSVFAGFTPGYITEIPVGNHTVTVSKEGYRDWNRTEDLSAGQTIVYNITLQEFLLNLDAPDYVIENSWFMVHVTESINNSPVPDATVAIAPTGTTFVTDENGDAFVLAPPVEGASNSTIVYLSAYKNDMTSATKQIIDYANPNAPEWIYGRVLEISTSIPVSGAGVCASLEGQNSSQVVATDSLGRFALPIQPGTYDVTAGKAGYTTVEVTDVVIGNGTSTEIYFFLTPLPSLTINAPCQVNEGATFNVVITSGTNTSIPGVTVHFNNISCVTGQDGMVQFTAPNVTQTTQYLITAEKIGYQSAEFYITIRDVSHVPSTVYVDDDFNPNTTGWGYDRFNTIQAGIDAVADHGYVWVEDGYYLENILINKPICVYGSTYGSTNSIIDGGHNGHVVTITSDNVYFAWFTIINSGSYQAGVLLDHCDGSNVLLSTIRSCAYGVACEFSTGGYIQDLHIQGAQIGILLEYSTLVTVLDNTITGSSISGIHVIHSSNNNSIYQNNLVNNTLSAFATGFNTWDRATQQVHRGNYWSDYLTKYPHAHESQQYPGCWDTPYVISSGNVDYYPLIHPWSWG